MQNEHCFHVRGKRAGQRRCSQVLVKSNMTGYFILVPAQLCSSQQPVFTVAFSPLDRLIYSHTS